MRKKMIMMACLIMTSSAICCTKSEQKLGNETAGQGNESTTATKDNAWEEGTPPVLAFCVKELPLFAPFNEGDLMNEGKALKEAPGKYTKFILGEQVFDVTYKEEKNKQLEHDDSFMNQYIYKMKDEMKGQVYSYADAKAVEEYLRSHGETTAEGEIIEQEYAYGILVSADYLKNHKTIKFFSTITEDPSEPQFPASTVAQVEKMVGEKVESNRIAHIFGDDEYNFGVMKMKPNDKYALAVWVLSKGDEVSILTDTCEVENGQVYWSSYDPEEYMEPAVVTVVKGKNGLDIYCQHSSNDEMMNFMLIRQQGRTLRKYDMGGFYQMYE